MAYIHVKDATQGNIGPASDVIVSDANGVVLARFTSMRFSEFEATRNTKDDVDSLVHSIAWPPARLSETPYTFEHVVLFDHEEAIERYGLELEGRGISTSILTSPSGLAPVQTSTSLANAEQDCEMLFDIVKAVASQGLDARIFVLTHGALSGSSASGLANGALVGLSRIIAAEQPNIWGALIDNEADAFPFQAVKYVQNADIVKVEDSVARAARLRSMPATRIVSRPQFDVRSESTYLITGGLGALGLEVADFLLEKGARRLVLVSRRKLPPRRQWSAADELSYKLDAFDLPSAEGVVHAAGVIEDQLVLSTTPSTFNRVLAPKIRGALALHSLFPPASLSFFVLFSSCGQLFGFPGQASYAAGNAFLDTLAEHRRAQGDNALALQYTSWRGMGLAASSEASADFIEADLESKGITSVSKEEALKAWEHAAKFDLAHGVVLRCRELEHDEQLAMDIIEDVAVRKAAPSLSCSPNGSSNTSPAATTQPANSVPPPGPERSKYLLDSITDCVALVLQLDASDVDSKPALPDLGMDSVMTVASRKELQKTLGVKVPPTLV
ncbi:KR domain-containing protein [Lophiotrema nucula]|uniref:KR domain-containing protein n=1 Tax=Lophiotrema nucula TaxID=690887 RepID=A0A6A5YED1_9PLEO|nr:KR domain-containing protein [Lophiotrema nucula]